MVLKEITTRVWLRLTNSMPVAGVAVSGMLAVSGCGMFVGVAPAADEGDETGFSSNREDEDDTSLPPRPPSTSGEGSGTPDGSGGNEASTDPDSDADSGSVPDTDSNPNDESAEAENEAMASSSGDDGNNDQGMSDSSDPDSGNDEKGVDDSAGSAEEGPGDSGEDEPAELVRIEILEAQRSVELDLGVSKTLSYQAIGHYDDGSEEDISDEASWGTSKAEYGVFSGSLLKIPAFVGTTVAYNQITASLDGFRADGVLTVVAYDFDEQHYLILPYSDEAGPTSSDEVEVGVPYPDLDVFINVDSTGSMADEITLLQKNLGDFAESMEDDYPSIQFGLGRFDDFPVSPFGNYVGESSDLSCELSGEHDQPFVLLQEMTSNGTGLQTAASTLASRCGADFPESWIESLYQIATGEGLDEPGPRTEVAANHSGRGGAGFRESSTPIVVTLTDAVSHSPGESGACGGSSLDYDSVVRPHAHTRSESKQALGQICAKATTIGSLQYATTNVCSPFRDGLDFATASGARVHPMAWAGLGRPAGCANGQCCTGANGTGVAPDSDGLCPLVFQIPKDGSGVKGALETVIRASAEYIPSDVQLSVIGEDLSGGKNSGDFVFDVLAKSSGLAPLAALPAPAKVGGRFERVYPKTDLVFAIQGHNTIVQEKTDVQVFELQVRAKNQDCASQTFDEATLHVVVPAKLN